MPDVRPDIRPDRTSGFDPDPADFQPDEPDFLGIFFRHFNTFFVQSFRFSSLVSYQKTVSSRGVPMIGDRIGRLSAVFKKIGK